MATDEPDAAALDAFLAQLQETTPSHRASASLTATRRFTDFWRHPVPTLKPIPEITRGFRIRIDLQHTKPPVWRRFDVSGDITLPRLHEVLQAAMGWTDSHLHQFRTSNDRNPPRFLTQFDLDEGDEGLPEDEVRLDQVITAAGDRLWYDYDFGDGWEHVLRVEQVLDVPPHTPMCVTGKRACPPEDCGGVWGYHEMAQWARSDFAPALRPKVFGSAKEARAWLPADWHPDVFDLEETNELIALVVAEPPPVTEELASLLDLERTRGSRNLREALADPIFHGPADVSAEDAARLTAPFRVLLEVIGDGADLTNAGYLKPADVAQIAARAGITEWWIGAANREERTWPVAELRAIARSLGLVAVRKGRIAPTQAAKRYEGNPERLLHHIIGRLPLGTSPAERHAGWAAIVTVGREFPAELWDGLISGILFDLGWRSNNDHYTMPPSESPTLEVLTLLAGTGHTGGRARGTDPAVAAAARAAIKP